MLAPALSYFTWAKQQDMGPAYRLYREYLQVIQATVPDRRLTLKAPSHTPYLTDILREIPSARFVQTHRDPVEAAGSLASLVHSMMGVTSPSITGAEAGATALVVLTWMAESCVAQREQNALPIVDVQYRDLVSDPLATVRQIYAGHALEWTDEVEMSITKAVADRPQHKQGRHRYTLADFGLSEGQVREAVRPYTDRFLDGA
jgi:hypothetical protein